MTCKTCTRDLPAESFRLRYISPKGHDVRKKQCYPCELEANKIRSKAWRRRQSFKLNRPVYGVFKIAV